MSSPRVEIEEITDESILVKISNIDISIANSIRRMALEEVDCMAMEIVDIISNSARTHDFQKLAHRLGTIPFVSTDADKYLYTHECDCEDGKCSKCYVEYSLNVKNVEDKVRIVTTRDLIPKDESTTVTPAHQSATGSIYIRSLEPGEEITLKGEVRKGNGLLHAKYQIPSRISLKSASIIELDQKQLSVLSEDQLKGVIASCDANVFRYNEEKKQLETIEDSKDCRSCTKCNCCVEYIDSLNLNLKHPIKIIPRTDYYLMRFTTNGSLKPEEVAAHAICNFVTKLKNIVKELAVAQQF